jgi:hypothetical protein
VALPALPSLCTGTPFNIATEQAYVRQYRSQFGYNFGQPLLSFAVYSERTVPHEFYKKANILYISSPNINPETIEFYYKMIKDFAPCGD